MFCPSIDRRLYYRMIGGPRVNLSKVKKPSRRRPTGVPAHCVTVGHRLTLSSSAPEPGTLRLAVALAGRTLMERSFTASRPKARFHVALGFLSADLAIVFDVFSGELRASASVAVRNVMRPSKGQWRRLIDASDVTVVRFAPSVGRVAGSTAVHVPTIDDDQWGRSLPCSPVILRVFVDDAKRLLAPAGQRAKRALFPQHPPFVFNTVACVGCDPGDDERRYNDPDSHWFNVFFGYYQIDCPKQLWSRPFGYRSASGAESVIVADDILRIGLADWNWFSNWMYGLPSDVALAYSSPETSRATVGDQELHQIGAKWWHRVRLNDVDVASCHEGPGDGARRLVHNSPLDLIWRRSFGPSCPRRQWPSSFPPTRLLAVCELCYWEDDEEFHTVFFGATAQAETDPGFIQTQLSALHAIIETDYPGLGFPC